MHLYRAVDAGGNTVEFMLRPARDAVSAKRFFRKALRAKHTLLPRLINVDRDLIGLGVAAIINQVNATKQPKPVTSDERKLIGRVNAIPDFISEHPDLADEARRVNRGETLPPGRNHVGEAQQKMRELQGVIDYLNGVRLWRDAAGQADIEYSVAPSNRCIFTAHLPLIWPSTSATYLWQPQAVYNAPDMSG